MTPGQRIHELDDINQSLATALNEAGLAVKALSNATLDDANDGSENGKNVEARKEDFREHVKAYYTGVQAAIAKLRRQAYALEEAGVISAEAPTLGANPQQRQPNAMGASDRNAPAAGSVQEVGKITNGGLGNLDVGWLNSRGNKVSAEKEAELVAEAKILLQGSTSGAARSDEAGLT